MPPSEMQSILSISQRPENAFCADCGAANPQWASANLGAFICIKCSGIHRAIGAHITLVKSCTLDKWAPNYLAIMDKVGNAVLNAYWECNLPGDYVRPNHSQPHAMKRFIEQKYAEKKWADSNKTPPHLNLDKVQSEPKQIPKKEPVKIPMKQATQSGRRRHTRKTPDCAEGTKTKAEPNSMKRSATVGSFTGNNHSGQSEKGGIGIEALVQPASKAKDNTVVLQTTSRGDDIDEFFDESQAATEKQPQLEEDSDLEDFFAAEEPSKPAQQKQSSQKEAAFFGTGKAISPPPPKPFFEEEEDEEEELPEFHGLPQIPQKQPEKVEKKVEEAPVEQEPALPKEIITSGFVGKEQEPKAKQNQEISRAESSDQKSEQSEEEVLKPNPKVVGKSRNGTCFRDKVEVHKEGSVGEEEEEHEVRQNPKVLPRQRTPPVFGAQGSGSTAKNGGNPRVLKKTGSNPAFNAPSSRNNDASKAPEQRNQRVIRTNSSPAFSRPTQTNPKTVQRQEFPTLDDEDDIEDFFGDSRPKQNDPPPGQGKVMETCTFIPDPSTKVEPRSKVRQFTKNVKTAFGNLIEQVKKDKSVPRQQVLPPADKNEDKNKDKDEDKEDLESFFGSD